MLGIVILVVLTLVVSSFLNKHLDRQHQRKIENLKQAREREKEEYKMKLKKLEIEREVFFQEQYIKIISKIIDK